MVLLSSLDPHQGAGEWGLVVLLGGQDPAVTMRGISEGQVDLLEVILEDPEPTPHMMDILKDQAGPLMVILEVQVEHLGDIMEGLEVLLGDIMEGLEALLGDIMEGLEALLGDTTVGLGGQEVPLGCTVECKADIREALAVPQWVPKEGWGCPLEDMLEVLEHPPLDALEGRVDLVRQSLAIIPISRRVGANGRVAGRWM